MVAGIRQHSQQRPGHIASGPVKGLGDRAPIVLNRLSQGRLKRPLSGASRLKGHLES